jgi:hypothetical protein
VKRLGKVTIRHILDEDPDLSYLQHEMDGDRIVSSCAYSNEDIELLGLETVKGYIEEDRQRLKAFYRDDWWMIGIRAEAEVLTGEGLCWLCNTVSSGGLWGIESDSGKAYLKEVADDELSSLRDTLKELGFEDAEIDMAFTSAEVVGPFDSQRRKRCA